MDSLGAIVWPEMLLAWDSTQGIPLFPGWAEEEEAGKGVHISGQDWRRLPSTEQMCHGGDLMLGGACPLLHPEIRQPGLFRCVSQSIRGALCLTSFPGDHSHSWKVAVLGSRHLILQTQISKSHPTSGPSLSVCGGKKNTFRQVKLFSNFRIIS